MRNAGRSPFQTCSISPVGPSNVTRSETNAKRYTEAFLAGFLILFGARLAGGCTSGLIISGMTQLSVAGFVFAAGVFATGIGTAKFMQAIRVGAR